MNGLMMDWPLLIPSILRRAAQFFPEKEIVSRWADGTLHRLNYGDLEPPRPPADERACASWASSPATASRRLPGTSHRHLELYFAVPVDRRGPAHDQLPAARASSSATSSTTPRIG